MAVLLTLIESNGMWEVVGKVTNPVTLVAFALAVALGVMQAWLGSKRKSIPNVFWIVLVALVLIGVAAALYQKPNGEIYRVRVTVVDPQSIPVEDAKVWSCFGGEPKRVAGGWRFDIPEESRPKEGKLAIFASKESAFLTGQADLTLGDDHNPAVAINLKRDDSAKIRGQVVDGKNRRSPGREYSSLAMRLNLFSPKKAGTLNCRPTLQSVSRCSCMRKRAA